MKFLTLLRSTNKNSFVIAAMAILIHFSSISLKAAPASFSVIVKTTGSYINDVEVLSVFESPNILYFDYVYSPPSDYFILYQMSRDEALQIPLHLL